MPAASRAHHLQAGSESSATRRSVVDDLLAELRERAATAEDPRPVELIETHISWVLLGPEVYKIKKPVTLPFLDFASFEARERACRTEVRINRRLAPRTYLGVVPIRRRSDGHFTFRAGGAIVEWAVQMRRLDDERRADVLLARGALSRDHVDALAVAIAAFHADSASTLRIARYGAPEIVERNVVDNFAALRASPVELVPDAVVSEIERGQSEFVRDHRDLFERRMIDGAIRDGHGDLRLEHVFLHEHDDDFEVIDGIEFDDRYRFADTCADIAFLAMDLARLGRVDLAERFVAMYARAANDFELYRLLDFYESYRACVRAKIAASTLARDGVPDDTAKAAHADARRYLVLAQSARRRSVLDPVLVAVAGGIASGKSSVAARLGDELSAPIVDADRTRKHMLGLAPTAHPVAAKAWEGAYDRAFSDRVYDEVLRRADAVLTSGRPVIVDASFRSATARAAVRELAKAHRVPFRLLECAAPVELCRARLAARERATSVSDATPEILDAFVAAYEPITELDATEHIRVDTSGELEYAVHQVKREIETWPRGLLR